MQVEIPSEVIKMAEAIIKKQVINIPQAKRMKEQFANRILKLIKAEN